MKGRYLAVFPIVVFAAVVLMPIMMLYGAAGNRPPVVSNVHAEQRPGTKLVDITYDVEDPDGDLLTISVEISDDGGKTFTVPAKTFSGDIGPGIAPGKNKHIVWDAGKDVPGVFGMNYRAKVIASDGKPGDEEIVGKDGMPMVLIPAGEFEMGDHFNEGDSNELPVHTVYVDSFYIDKYEVTNEMYARFLNEIGRNEDEEGHQLLDINDSDCLIEFVGGQYRPKAGYEKHPVIEVSWYGAMAYAKWAGKRLPTEAEWEKAARGGLVGKRYPWGDDITHDMANYDGTGGRDRWDKTAPVGSFPPNGYGLYDMAGNVWEWCLDWYDGEYYSKSPRENPKGPELGESRVVRGGSWDYSPNYLRVADRYYYGPQGTSNSVGFRCALSVTP